LRPVEFNDAVRRRKMWRTFSGEPVDPPVLDRILDVARRGPSAGFSQGVSFLVLEGEEQTARFWDAVIREEDWPREGLRRAPVLVVPLAGKDAYLSRYAESDKGWADRDEARWPVPYWVVDASFAAMLILLAAVDEGLGGLFFGLDSLERYDDLRGAFGIPEEWQPIGVIAMGHKEPDPEPSSRDTRTRRSFDDVVHRGRW
jgi:nitroreductase